MKNILSIVPALLLAGCWTFNETPYPETAATAASEAAAKRTLTLTGFDAVLTEYEAVHGFRAVYVPGYHGHRYCEPSHYEMMPSVTYVPQFRATDMFLRRAQDAVERAGFVLGAGVTDRTVDVRFEGPFVPESDLLADFAWNVLSVFFCDYGSTRWTARLRIRDSKTGRLVFSHDYEQAFETHAVGLLPIFCASSHTHLSAAHMQSWCLAALTDRAVADATAFLASEK